jgi:hypothetical protein
MVDSSGIVRYMAEKNRLGMGGLSDTGKATNGEKGFWFLF